MHTKNDSLTNLSFIEAAVFEYPGCAREVWGGYVWIVGGNEQRWSKRATYSECITTVWEVVNRLGVAEAFDLCDEEVK